MIVILFLLIANQTFAADCGNSGLNEGQEIRLDKSGKLSDFKIQDQDGMGTCYSNALSLMLHSVSGKTPSYLMLARSFGRTKDGSDVINKISEKVQLAMNGGVICDTFAHVQKGIQNEPFPICLQDSIDLEKKVVRSGDPIGKQAELLTTYLAWASSLDANNSANKKVLSEVKQVIEKYRKEAKASCSRIYPSYLAKKLYDALVISTSQNSKCNLLSEEKKDQDNLCLALRLLIDESGLGGSWLPTSDGGTVLDLYKKEVRFNFFYKTTDRAI